MSIAEWTEQLFILFGAGIKGKRFLHFLGYDYVDSFCDNYKSGEVYEGKQIISYSELKLIHKNYCVVLTVTDLEHEREISRQLYRDGIDFCYAEELEKEIIEKEGHFYNMLNKRPELSYEKSTNWYIYGDRFESAGYVGDYFWQDLWGAKHIFSDKPEIHYDIGSRVDGFISHLLVFGQKVCLLDIRPLEINEPNIMFTQCDATNLQAIEDNTVESLSALCSLEHFGLGRYSDAIDPEACFKCFNAIQRKMRSGGRVYLSVPVGKEHLEFNAHRIFYASTIKDSFQDMKLEEYSIITASGIKYDVALNQYDNWTEKGGLTGLFKFKKI